MQFLRLTARPSAYSAPTGACSSPLHARAVHTRQSGGGLLRTHAAYARRSGFYRWSYGPGPKGQRAYSFVGEEVGSGKEGKEADGGSAGPEKELVWATSA